MNLQESPNELLSFVRVANFTVALHTHRIMTKAEAGTRSGLLLLQA